MRSLVSTLVIVFLALFGAVQQAQATSLYQVLEPVTATNTEARNQAQQKAFATMVWRLSGQAASDNELLKPYLDNPQDLVSRYTQGDGTLLISFDAASMLNLLHEAGMPVWGSQRPVILLWWQQQDLHGFQLLNDSQQDAATIKQAADYAGLPVRFPLADLQEQMLAENLNIEASNEQVALLLQRYGADVFLQVKQHEDNERINVSWRLLEKGKLQRGSEQAAAVTEAATNLFTQLASGFVKRYAVLPGEGQPLYIQVDGVDIPRLQQLQRALRPFSPVLVKLQASSAVWQVRALPEQLEAVLELLQLKKLALPAKEEVLIEQEIVVQDEQGLEQIAEEQLDSTTEYQSELEQLLAPEQSDNNISSTQQLDIDMLFAW